MSENLLPADILQLYQVKEYRHACAILKEDYPVEWENIIEVLRNFRLYESQITVGGGQKSLVSESIDSHFYALKWVEKNFIVENKVIGWVGKDTLEKVVDENILESKTHKIDCFKSKIGLEIEWNNKDTFFDRDLDKFRHLFDLGVISVGVIITRCTHLQKEVFNPLGIGNKYGASTTHLAKLLSKLNGGGGGGCPILVFGISKNLYVSDISGAPLTAIVDK